MNTPPSRRTYTASVWTAVTTILFLSAAMMFVVFGASDRASRAEAFGNPFVIGSVPGERTNSPAAGERWSLATTRVSETGRTPAPAEPQPAAALERRDPSAAAQRLPRSPDPLDLARWLASEKRWQEALRVYDQLLAGRAADAGLIIERARVLAWSGDNRGAAAALVPVLAASAATAELRLEHARYLWWGGEALAADSALSALLHLQPDHSAAASLREGIRDAVQPPSAVAEQWLRQRSGPADHLRLARAYTREGLAARAMPHYRAALAGHSQPDSLALEVAYVATDADSLTLAAEALERFLEAHPGDNETRLRLARLYSWTGVVERARHHYEMLLPRADPAVLLELGQLEAWHGSRIRAEELLTRLNREHGPVPPALKLLGDLARWSGDWETAAALYGTAAALDPDLHGLGEALQEAERLRLAAALAAPRHPRWLADVHGFGDSERFRWLTSRMTRRHIAARHSAGISVLQDRWAGVGPGGVATPGVGHGVELTSEVQIAPAWNARGSFGVRSHDGSLNYLTGTGEISYAMRDATAISLRFAHQPAGARAATAAALQAETVSDLLQLTVNRPLGQWHLWSQADAERLASNLGTTTRTAASIALSRELGGGWSALAAVGAMTTDSTAPVLAGWGPLYWTPSAYVSPSAGVRYHADLGSGWRLGGRFVPAYAWIRERDSSVRRFTSDHVAVLGGGAEATYVRGPWQVDASAEWNGAADASYRASGIRLQATFAPRLRP